MYNCVIGVCVVLLSVRRSLRRGESVKYLISDDVIAYIKKHKLYQVHVYTYIVCVCALSVIVPSGNDFTVILCNYSFYIVLVTPPFVNLFSAGT